eukprot:TRINITY_DN980_c0_g1_i4.p1 TRINITY_DN980_c0_g1~~TRINITY_DN980_c0_g1_i4.p1  ORF type:complete len:375 (-),score=51.36 TRINITY_DN980_c0_g1_i4:158-1282(-)
MKLLSTRLWHSITPRMCFCQVIRAGSTDKQFSSQTKPTSETVKETNLKIMFFGTDNFALETLRKLHERQRLKVINHLEVCCISDSGTPVCKYAKENGLKMHLYPPPIDSGQFDLGVVASFGKLISSSVISKFKYGMINVHGSLLPKLRGAAPIIYAIKQGLPETGITIMKIKPKKFDVGEMLAQERIEIPRDMLRSDLTHKMAILGSDLVCQVVENLEAYEKTATVQDNSEATLAPVVNKSIAFIDFHKQSNYEIYNLWRSVHDIVKLRCKWGPTNTVTRFKVVHPPWHIEHLQLDSTKLPGETVFLKVNKKQNFLCIKCRDGWIAVDEIMYGKRKVMSSRDFANGFLRIDKTKPLPPSENNNSIAMFVKDEET